MPKRAFNGVLKVLAYFAEKENKEVTMYQIQRELGMRYDTLARAIEVLKNIGFLEERTDPGPPARRLIKPTEKGRQAAQHAKELLRLAGLF